MRFIFSILAFILFGTFTLVGQEEKTERVVLDGNIMTAHISNEDTLFIMDDLEAVSITSKRTFDSEKDYLMYLRYRKYAQIVYPYAAEAIRIFQEVETDTETMNRWKKKRHIKGLQKELKEEFQDPLKKLTRTQGMILTKMIEQELDTPMHELLKGLKGTFTAFYWHQFGKVYGYDLKRGYVIGDDHILDIVLQDFDISYEVE